jgi:hypothetical protein
VPDTLDYMASNDPTITALRSRFGDEKATWSAQLYDMLYQFDTKGVKKATLDKADELGLLRPGKAVNEAERLAQVTVETDPLFAAFVDRIVEQNRSSFMEASRMVGGNMSRSNAERVLNSYWLYWPLSYQLKAGKWLFDVMAKKSAAGPNATGALLIEEARQTHIDRMSTDQSYADIFANNPTLWYTAQMILPITPWDMGVSLSRLPRYVGSWLGVFPEYKSVQDPLSAAQKMTDLGPIYSLELAQRVKSEAQRNN